MVEKTIAEKLQVKPGKFFRILNQPPDVSRILAQLPTGASFASESQPADVVLFFVKSMSEVKSLFPLDVNLIKLDGIPWLAYPKKTSAIKTDLDRDTIWKFLQTIGWTGVSMISINDTWSGFRMKKVS
jgi:hypothetical protein